jgi:hypothetical protein
VFLLSRILSHHSSEQVLDWGQLRLVVAEVVLLLWLGHQAVDAGAAAAVPCACPVVHLC